MSSYEQLGLFYLGRRYDLAAAARTSEPLLYDSKDLLTHAVCVRMTGSGKTGLGIGLIEEAAIDGVPVLAIDPKGDLANLLLAFPNLTAADFAPWVSTSEAATLGLSVESLAAREASTWKDGLAEWDGFRLRASGSRPWAWAPGFWAWPATLGGEPSDHRVRRGGPSGPPGTE